MQLNHHHFSNKFNPNLRTLPRRISAGDLAAGSRRAISGNGTFNYDADRGRSEQRVGDVTPGALVMWMFTEVDIPAVCTRAAKAVDAATLITP
jgi:hypothetical protein